MKTSNKQKEINKSLKGLYLKSPHARTIWNNLANNQAASNFVENQLLYHFSNQLTKEQQIKCYKEEIISFAKERDEKINKINIKYNALIINIKDKIEELLTSKFDKITKEIKKEEEEDNKEDNFVENLIKGSK